jgi:choline dehydrogenase
MLDIYRRIEDWHGAPDPKYLGTGGLLFVQPAPTPTRSLLPWWKERAQLGFRLSRVTTMEGDGGASILDYARSRWKTPILFRSYTFPYMDRDNLTVLTHALATRLTLEGNRATGVEILYDGKVQRVTAGLEVILSLGAIYAPKLLMLSGIGDEAVLQQLGIPLVQHLPGVGRNFHDHFGISRIREYQQPLPPRNKGGEATFFWKSDSSLDTPDLQTCQAEIPVHTAEIAATFNPPAGSWTMFGGVVRPKSRGHICLIGSNPLDPIQIEANNSVAPGRHESCNGLREALPRNRQFSPASPFHQARSDATQLERSRP